MKKTITRVMMLLLAAAMLMGTLAGCAKKNDIRIKKQLGSFESACRAGDLEGVLDCCDPHIVKPLKSTLGFLGTDLSQISELVYGIIGLGDSLLQDDQQIQEMLSSLDFKLKSCEYNDEKDYCNATVTVSCDVYDEHYEEDTIIPFVLRDDTWYLAMN